MDGMMRISRFGKSMTKSGCRSVRILMMVSSVGSQGGEAGPGASIRRIIYSGRVMRQGELGSSRGQTLVTPDLVNHALLGLMYKPWDVPHIICDMYDDVRREKNSKRIHKCKNIHTINLLCYL